MIIAPRWAFHLLFGSPPPQSEVFLPLFQNSPHYFTLTPRGFRPPLTVSDLPLTVSDLALTDSDLSLSVSVLYLLFQTSPHRSRPLLIVSDFSSPVRASPSLFQVF